MDIQGIVHYELFDPNQTTIFYLYGNQLGRLKTAFDKNIFPSSTEKDWFGWVLWHTNHCGLFNAKLSPYIYIKYLWFGLVGSYGISAIVGYLMPNPLSIYVLNIFIWFCWVLWRINHCRLFNANSSLYIYIKYIWFGFVGFYGISTLVGHLKPNPLYIYIYIKYIWFGFVGSYGVSIVVGYLMPNHLYIVSKVGDLGMTRYEIEP